MGPSKAKGGFLTGLAVVRPGQIDRQLFIWKLRVRLLVHKISAALFYAAASHRVIKFLVLPVVLQSQPLGMFIVIQQFPADELRRRTFGNHVSIGVPLYHRNPVVERFSVIHVDLTVITGFYMLCRQCLSGRGKVFFRTVVDIVT